MLQKSPMYAYIPAKDVARARQFYEHKLGFKAGPELAGGVAYECGGQTACFLYPTPNAGTSQASQAFWQVDDVDREITELKARGVVFEDYAIPGEKSASGAITAGGAKAAWF
jgi:catechol 2,3-dioxygenase-like lactoylglutathione lyase family enzyme